MTNAGLVTGDAGADILGMAAVGLVGHLWVADQGAGHATDIGLPAGQNQFGFLRLVDTPGDEQRYRQAGLEGPGFTGEVRSFNGHGRDDMHRPPERCRGTGDDMHIVQRALQGLYRRQRFILGQAFSVALVGADTQANDEVIGGGGAHGGDHFTQEAQALCKLAVVAVAAAINPRVDELGWQVAVAGDHFDAIEPSLMQAPGGIGIALHDFIDHFLIQRPRHDPETFIGHCRR
ncbi:hypothetical protein D3C72_1485120 [compost metagenome]